jgi:hypothetical protein
VIGVVIVLCIVLLVIGIVFMKRSRRKVEKAEGRKEPNPIYSQYHRGWEGEGDYGDGDQQEVRDSNGYYGSPDKEGATRVSDFNPLYGH